MARKKKDDARRIKFVRAYHANANGVDAAKAAGYKGTWATLRSVASRLLRRQDVKDELTRLWEKTETDGIASREEAVRTLTQQLRFDLGKLLMDKENVERTGDCAFSSQAVSQKRDYYQKERSRFAEPCNTCVHKYEELDSPMCPCTNCVHYTS